MENKPSFGGNYFNWIWLGFSPTALSPFFFFPGVCVLTLFIRPCPSVLASSSSGLSCSQQVWFLNTKEWKKITGKTQSFNLGHESITRAALLSMRQCRFQTAPKDVLTLTCLFPCQSNLEHVQLLLSSGILFRSWVRANNNLFDDDRSSCDWHYNVYFHLCSKHQKHQGSQMFAWLPTQLILVIFMSLQEMFSVLAGGWHFLWWQIRRMTRL